MLPRTGAGDRPCGSDTFHASDSTAEVDMRRIFPAIASTVGVTALLFTAVSAPAIAAEDAVVLSADCMEHTLPANDDGSTSAVPLPFGVNFYGETFSEVWINNNGNVTFESPLDDFTPWGLAETSRKIIAPFFADVDTRSSGTDPVRYGWGSTTFNGHAALCVNWLNVGYYSLHEDKLNSFQLLLVQREDSPDPGDFDIVFNYGSVNWETGDASGGVSGLGGSSAVAGFSNGSGLPGTYYELPGSAVNGAFLDSSPTGLAVTSSYSDTSGRHVFKVRGGAAPLVDYVALGDSYQSGEGAGDYYSETNNDANKCHRSPHAYPELLVARGVVPLNLDFGACSGATVGELSLASSATRPPYDDGIAQLDRLSASTKLVTIGVGGNDMGFAPVLEECIKELPNWPFIPASCEESHSAAIDAAFEVLTDGGVLSDLYREIRDRAPFARVAVLGYPKFFPKDGSANGTPLSDFCAGIRTTDQLWINSEIRRLNGGIRAAARAAGLQYVDIYNTSDEHELCKAPAVEYFFNQIVLAESSESFHPTAYGQAVIADVVESALEGAEPGQTFNVIQGSYVTSTFLATSGDLHVSTQWPGSDVVLSLLSPSGRTITRDTLAADVTHEVGPTFESYHVIDAEPGTWTATLYGADVETGGEVTRLDVWQPPAANVPPTALFSQAVAGATVTVDASASTDPDGSVTEYIWDFGDGTTASGVTASHNYSSAGNYLVTLAVSDEDGDQGFATGATVVAVADYDFQVVTGAIQNAVGTVKYGYSATVNFTLGGDQGLNVFTSGYPSSKTVTCGAYLANGEWIYPEAYVVTPTAPLSASRLTYNATTSVYKYEWSTTGTKKGSCQELTFKLKDGSELRARYYISP